MRLMPRALSTRRCRTRLTKDALQHRRDVACGGLLDTCSRALRTTGDPRPPRSYPQQEGALVHT
eukprot:1100974-Pyramimonas_sp.AAC.1